jgi:Leucine-rich repeat (LRR) protein
LQRLEFPNNQLSSLPPEIGNLVNLRDLDLSHNNLSSLPPEIGNLSSLVQLKLPNNQLSALPAEIGNLSILRLLYLFDNQLTILPPEIAKLDSLCYLDLRGNLFQSIPFEIHPLERLGTLEQCYEDNEGLLLDDYLLDTLPQEVANGGTSAILAYLENEAWWHFQRLIGSISGTIGLLTAAVLAWRWKYRRGKRKNSEKAKVERA